MLRFLTAVPAGKVRFTIFDPVGLGQNFSTFMNLKDVDELMVNSRIWTEQAQIEHRLLDLTEHMENVIQTYLRNEYQSIEQYNEMAGEVAEPYRVLVVANYPANFSDIAQRRLVSIAQSGPRCGVYVLVSLDPKLQNATNQLAKDLEPSCLNLIWKDGKFVWKDSPFEQYPAQARHPARRHRAEPDRQDLRRGGQEGQAGRGAVLGHRPQARQDLELGQPVDDRRPDGPRRGHQVPEPHARQGDLAARPDRRQDRFG